ncbi:MAG: hypothetical protein MI923_23795 [Phycisphaerales bacterium]|nr:hypothetical protein [Phycisphaerales bacterium]
MSTRLLSRSLLLMVFAAVCCAWTNPDSTRGPNASNRRAYLAVVNETECTVCVYLNDEFVLRCEPFTKETIACRIFGDVELVARSRCDVWGPETVELIPGKTTTWRLSGTNQLDRWRFTAPTAFLSVL